MSALFGSCPFVKVYIDDLINHSTSFQEHIHLVRYVTNILNQSNLKASPVKCFFAQLALLALGYCIDHNGIHIATEKLLQITDWQEPTSGRILEKHLGFFNFFRELIPNYSTLMAPLEALRKQNSIQWTNQYRQLYKTVQAILSCHFQRGTSHFMWQRTLPIKE